MADTAASAVCACLQPIWNSAYEGIELQLKPICGFKKEVGKLKSRFSNIEEAISKVADVHLLAILDVLLDPERNEDNEKLVRKWFHKLKDGYYEVDDIVDKWNAANLMSKLDKDHASKKVCFCVSSFYFLRLSLHREIAFNIKGLNEKLHNFDDDASKRQTNSILIREAIERLKPETTSSWDFSRVYGRHNEKDILISKLLRGNNEDGSWLGKTIPIVGMGGVGKTTLAQLVFCDNAVKNHFQKRIWVSVPYTFNLNKIAKVIIEGVQGEAAPDFVALDSLLNRIRSSITGIRFLLVLDDVWTIEDAAWNQLRATLDNSDAGNRILVTTQNYNVVQMMGASNDSVLHLQLLPENDCWSILSPLASEAFNDQMNEYLGDVRSKFLYKCKGLPLVAHTLENRLRFEDTKQHWDKVLQSELSHFQKKVFVPFLLNYYNLSSLQKHCFSYCSIFPRNYEIEKVDVVELWMSQGYFSQRENAEDDALNCFKILAKRYLFLEAIKDYGGDIIKCKMHDIVHEFAHFLTKDEHLLMELEDADEVNKSTEGNIEAYHFTLLLKTSEAQIPTSMNNRKNLRTLFIVRSEPLTPLACGLLVKLSCLRTLNLRHCNIKELPEDIDKLVHLRYLNLSGNSLEELPNALCNLFNMQTLRMNACTQLQRLPNDMGKLVNLRHLYIDGCDKLEAVPKQIGRLTCLRKLDMFVVPSLDYLQRNEALRLENLNRMQNLRGFIHVSRCGNIVITDYNQSRRTQLSNNLGCFIEVKLDFIGSTESTEIGDEEEIVEALRPHSELKSLEIRGCRGTRVVYPTWLDSLTCLRRLVLSGCKNSEFLPPLGKLGSLESLRVEDMDGVKSVGLEFLAIDQRGDRGRRSAFPRLKELDFNRLCSWQEWEWTTGSGDDDPRIIIMPCLASLQISQCGILRVLPGFLQRMTQLQKLIITECEILKQRCGEGREEWDKVSRIPNIEIDGVMIRPRSVVEVQART